MRADGKDVTCTNHTCISTMSQQQHFRALFHFTTRRQSPGFTVFSFFSTSSYSTSYIIIVITMLSRHRSAQVRSLPAAGYLKKKFFLPAKNRWNLKSGKNWTNWRIMLIITYSNFLLFPHCFAFLLRFDLLFFVVIGGFWKMEYRWLVAAHCWRVARSWPPSRARQRTSAKSWYEFFFFSFCFPFLSFFCWLRITSSRQSVLLPLLSKRQNGQESEAELLVIRRPGCGWMKKPPN